jgi:hypothetical protein
MKRFLRSCYLTVFSNQTRLVNGKVVLCTLTVALATLVQSRLHTILNTYTSVSFANSDPWNGQAMFANRPWYPG